MLTYQKTDSPQSVILNPSEPPVGSVIWLHGLGADGYDFVPLIPELRLSTPLRFIFPHAPMRPVTLNNGYTMRAWFDIYSLHFNQQVDQAGINDSVQSLKKLISAEIANGVPSDRIILAGFSQGSVIVLNTGLNYPERLGGMIVLSGFLPDAEQLIQNGNPANRSTPIFIGHGSQDDLVPYQLGEMTAKALTKASYPVTFHSYPVAHAVAPKEISDIATWLGGVL